MEMIFSEIVALIQKVCPAKFQTERRKDSYFTDLYNSALQSRQWHRRHCFMLSLEKPTGFLGENVSDSTALRDKMSESTGFTSLYLHTSHPNLLYT